MFLSLGVLTCQRKKHKLSRNYIQTHMPIAFRSDLSKTFAFEKKNLVVQKDYE